MRMLLPSEYDQAYFEGREGDYRHNAGYGDYKESFHPQLAQRIVDQYPQLVGERVVEVGCAYGFLVQRLRDLGVDAWGRDVSSFAIGRADAAVAPYLQEGDILDAYPVGVKGVITCRTLVCFDETTLNSIVTHFNNTFGNKQLHILDMSLNEKYYQEQTLDWWVNTFPWESGTRLVMYENWNTEMVKV